MKNLNHIATVNLINWYNNIVANKENNQIKVDLIAITNDISTRYDHYIENFNSTELTNIVDSLYRKNHSGLLSCYRSEGVTLKALKKLIKDAQPHGLKGICQYCGILKPKTMDHYLPISVYPEFSTLAINLIPCCKDCNSKKLSYWKENQERGIVNFYIDEIPNQTFLFGRVVFVSGIPHIQYYLSNDNNLINDNFYDLVTKHYSRLDLLELYKGEATSELSEMIRTFKIYLDNPTIDSLKLKLLNDAAQLQNQFGMNYWKAILRITMANSDEILNYIIDEININRQN